MSRGKKRMGYELDIKIKFKGQEKYEGVECDIELKELCDDGSDPEYRIKVAKDKGGDSAEKLKSEISSEDVINEIIEKCRAVLNIIRDEA